MNTIEALLKKRPYRSSELVQELIKIEKVSPEAARKRLSRAKPPVKRIENIKLPNKEMVYYYEGQFGTSQFSDIVSNILIETNSAAGRALIGLKTVGGALPLSMFAKASATAAIHSRKHLHFQKVLDQLTELGLVHITKSGSNDDLVCISGMADIPSIQQATFVVEGIVLSIVKSWLSNLGIGSFNKIEIREEDPRYGVFAWDIVGPSYVNGIVKFKGGKIQNGFVVGDIILNKEITADLLKPFFYKLDSLKYQKKIRPFIILIIADYFERIALTELRKRGVIIASPKTILGKENADLLKSLIKSIDNATKTIKDNSDEIFGIIKKLNKIEGASLNLRSVVLDFIIARLYSLQGFVCEIRKKIQTSKGDRAEIDVVASRPESVICIEGKAVAPGNKVQKKEIEDWIEKSLPRINKWLAESELFDKTRKIEFYSSTEYDEEAFGLINKVEQEYKRIPIRFLKSSNIIKNLRAFNQHSLVEIYKEQFM